MIRSALALSALTVGLAACDPGGGTNVSVSGSAAVGVSSGGVSPVYTGISGGPPPGRTEAERRARKEYYRGPRGQEF